MKLISSIVFIVLLASLQAASAGAEFINAKDYSVFLNQVAATDAQRAYDEKMDGLVRTGEPGQYSYAVASGEEEKSMAYVDQIAARSYHHWKQNDVSADDSSSTPQIDLNLRSNRFSFYELSAAARVELSKKSSGKGSGETPWKTVEGAAIALATVLGGGSAAEAHAMREPEHSITLKDLVVEAPSERKSAEETRGKAATGIQRGVADAVQQQLQDKICHNIYTSCLAKVASFSLTQRMGAEGTLQEDARVTGEWAAAEKMALRNKEKAERAFDKVRRETKKAEGILLDAQKRQDAADPNSVEAVEADRAEIHASNIYERKRLEEELAEAKMESACATLMAIEMRNTAQCAAAEAEVKAAQKAEIEASEALEKLVKDQEELPIIQPVMRIAETLLQALKYAEAENTNFMMQALQEAQSSQYALEYERKEMTAEASGNHDIAYLWHVAAAHAHNQNRKAMEATTQCIKYRLKAQEAEKNSTLESKKLASEAQEIATQYWIIAEHRGKNVQAEEALQGLLKVSEKMKESAAYLIRAQQAHNLGNQELALCYRAVAARFQEESKQRGRSQTLENFLKQAEYLEKAQAARPVEDSELIACCKAIANQFQTESNQLIRSQSLEHLITQAEYLEKAQKAQAAGNEKLRVCYKAIAQNFQQKNFQILEPLIKQAEYVEKAQQARAAGNQELGGLYESIAQSYSFLAQDSPQREQEIERELGRVSDQFKWAKGQEEVAKQYPGGTLHLFWDQNQIQRKNQQIKEAAERLQEARGAYEKLSQLDHSIKAAREAARENIPVSLKRAAYLEKQEACLENARKAQAAGDADLAATWKELVDQANIAVSARDTAILSSAQRVLNHTLPELVKWLERTHEAQAAENSDLIYYCKKVVQQIRIITHQEVQVIQAYHQNLHAYVQNPVYNASLKAGAATNAAAQRFLQNAEQEWQNYQAQAKKAQKNSYPNPIEQSLTPSSTPWSPAMEKIKTVLKKRSQIAEALKAGKHDEVRSLAQAAKDAEMAAIAEIKRIQEEQIKWMQGI